jgi:hypothetical protein
MFDFIISVKYIKYYKANSTEQVIQKSLVSFLSLFLSLFSPSFKINKLVCVHYLSSQAYLHLSLPWLFAIWQYILEVKP